MRFKDARRGEDDVSAFGFEIDARAEDGLRTPGADRKCEPMVKATRTRLRDGMRWKFTMLGN